MTTLEVQRDREKPRLYRFAEREITIGFTPRSALALEPAAEKGASLVLVAPPDGPSSLRAHNGPGAFQLNGAPFTKEVSVKPGDVITSGSYRIAICQLPGDSAAPAAAPVDAQQEALTVAQGAPSDVEDATIPAPREAKATPPTPAPAPAPAPASASSPAPASAPAPAAAGAPATPRPASGLSYLYLFFAPIQEYLMDDEVSEVMINGPRQIYVERKGKLAATPAHFASDQALQAAVMNVARSVGRFFDKDNPRLDARLPDGSRVHAVMPPLSRAGTIVAIRKFRREKLTLQQLVKFGSISPEGARVIDMIVKLGRNLIVSGATSSGKTSVLNVLSALIPEYERILVLEDASELQLQQSHVVSFETRKADEHGKGEISIRDLVHSALRLRPDRLVVGEIRSGEAIDLLQAMNTGHDGSMSTIHANSARDSLLRLETCALLGGVEIPLSALREQVASAIHIVLQTARLFDGTRKITGITEVLGLKDREYQLQDILVFKHEGVDAEGRIQGRHAFTGYQPTFLNTARQRGFDLNGLFVE